MVAEQVSPKRPNIVPCAILIFCARERQQRTGRPLTCGFPWCSGRSVRGLRAGDHRRRRPAGAVRRVGGRARL